MAFDKVVDSQALDGALGAVADAIRGKTGSTEPMTLEQMPVAIAGIQTGGINGRSYELTLAKASGWVLLTELDEDVLDHINDPTLVVSLVHIGEYSYEFYSGALFIAGNTAVAKVSQYPSYGLANRQSAETTNAMGQILYPANNTSTDTSLGGLGTFRLSGTRYYLMPGDGFIRSGRYRLTFAW